MPCDCHQCIDDIFEFDELMNDRKQNECKKHKHSRKNRQNSKLTMESIMFNYEGIKIKFRYLFYTSTKNIELKFKKEKEKYIEIHVL